MGLIVGAAGIAAVALSDKDTRRKASKKAVEIKNRLRKWSNQTLTDLKAKKEGLKSDVDEEEFREKEIKETADKANNSFN